MFIFEILKAVIIGIVEGITEWLPVSSTGHMILLDEFIRLDVSAAFLELFLVVIQLGAILAVPFLFFEKLNVFSRGNDASENRKKISLWKKVFVGTIPAGVAGFLLDDLLDRYLYNYFVVAVALIAYGIIFIFTSKNGAENNKRVNSIDELTYNDSLKIGAFQVFSLIPGTSRSGATILGGMLCGVSREASAEFSFFMAIPIMLGASGLKTLKFFLEGFRASGVEVVLLLVGLIVSFFVSIAVIRFLMDYVKRHSFKIFGYYRILLGVIVLIYFLIKQRI